MIAFTSHYLYIRGTKNHAYGTECKQCFAASVKRTNRQAACYKTIWEENSGECLSYMSKVKPSKLQKVKRNDFADAVAYAQDILHSPVKKKAYAKKLKNGASVYHAAIKEWMGKASSR